MTRVALIGAGGFVGSSIGKALTAKSEIDLALVTRATYDAAHDDGPYDVLINTAMPSKRFWARQNPGLDFVETVEKTSKLANKWDAAKIIQISSISARSQLDTVYGRHKAAAEKLVEHSNNLILRLGPMYGEGLDKGVLIDILNGDPVAGNTFGPRLASILERKEREEDRVVVLKSRKDVTYERWIDVTGIIEKAGGIITLQIEEEQAQLVD